MIFFYSILLVVIFMFIILMDQAPQHWGLHADFKLGHYATYGDNADMAWVCPILSHVTKFMLGITVFVFVESRVVL